MSLALRPANEPPLVPASAAPARLALTLLAVVAAYLAVAWYFGGTQTLDAVARIGWRWIVLGLAMATLSYAVRAWRWHLLLRALGARVPVRSGAAIYLAGVALSVTPGKVGETVRSAFLTRHGVPVGSSLAAFVVDRLSDVVAVVSIALLALAFASGWGQAGVARWALVLAAVLALSLVARAVARSAAWPRLVSAVRLKLRLRMAAGWMLRAGRDYARLWRTALATRSCLLSLVAYTLQGGIYAGMVVQVAPHVSPWTALSIYASATLAGAASFIPGGIGAMEVALVWMLGLHGVDTASALAAALCLRAVTFWWGLVLGAGGLTLAGRARHG